MKPTINLSIAQPCQANWNEMTPNEYGKFCDQCQLMVVDFSKMSETEIKNYFTFNYGKKTCGYFKTSQLTETKNTWLHFANKIGTAFRQPSVKAMLLFLFTLLSSLSGCRKPSANSNHNHIIGDVDIMTMGEPSFFVEPKDSMETEPLYKKGKIKIVEE
jgi:hypothetical protein